MRSDSPWKSILHSERERLRDAGHEEKATPHPDKRSMSKNCAACNVDELDDGPNVG